MELSGLEPLAFPASRDALASTLSLDKFLYRTMRFPGFKLPLAAPRFRKGNELFLVHQYPRSSTSDRKTLSALMLSESS